MSNLPFWVVTGFIVYLAVLAIFEKEWADDDF